MKISNKIKTANGLFAVFSKSKIYPKNFFRNY